MSVKEYAYLKAFTISCTSFSRKLAFVYILTRRFTFVPHSSGGGKVVRTAYCIPIFLMVAKCAIVWLFIINFANSSVFLFLVL